MLETALQYWFNDQVVRGFLLLTILWPLLAWLCYWFLLRAWDKQRWAEIPRVLLWPLFWFSVLCLLLVSFPHITGTLSFIIGSGPVHHFGAVVFRSILRIAIGISLWFCVTTLLSVVYSEFLDRKYKVHGKDRERNAAALVTSLARPLAFVLVFAFVAWLFKFNLASYLITFGGMSVALAFALQRLLQNVLSGLSLSLDAPFSANDLIKVGNADKDGKSQIYQVVKRGVRVTTVRDIATHEIVYLPNNMLAEEPLIDVTRPTDDLRAVIDLGVPYDAPLRKVREILLDIANGHPHVVGPYGKKERAIHDKIYRLYVRGVFEECFQHYVELARLQCEDELNQAVLDLKRKLELWARFVDRTESKGFDRNEKKQLEMIAGELNYEADKVVRLTTEWQILLRNCTARGKHMPFRIESGDTKAGSGAWEIPKKKDDIEQYVVQYLQEGQIDGRRVDLGDLKSEKLKLDDKMKALGSFLQQLFSVRERISGEAVELAEDSASENAAPPTTALAENTWQEISKSDREKALRSMRAMRVAHCLSKLAEIPTEKEETRPAYLGANFVNLIQKTYNELGKEYVSLSRKFAKTIVDHERFDSDSQPSAELCKTQRAEVSQGFSIELCRTRSEDGYLSELFTQHILNHPLCEAAAGKIIDEDERSDLADMMRIWGDKTHELLKKVKMIQSQLKRAKSTAIDTKMRELATWLKEDFKDPFPAWKYPIAPVEGFDDSSIHLAIKIYIDNVRMEKYLRPFNTFTQFRLRIIERLGNEGITIPYPQRDIHIVESVVKNGNDEEREKAGA
jgi:small-conductance mechanosensitive channel